MIKETIVITCGIILFFGMLFGTVIYTANISKDITIQCLKENPGKILECKQLNSI